MTTNIGDYVHFIPAVKERPEFPACLDSRLVNSIDELKEALATKRDCIAWDTETSSLNPEEGFIVGYSFSFDGKVGYYVPVKHVTGTSLGHEALELLYQRLLQAKVTFVYNMRFDFRYMEYSGFDMSKVKYYDVSIGV